METVCKEARQRVEEAKEHASRVSEHLMKSRNELNDCRAELFSQLVESVPAAQEGLALRHDSQATMSFFQHSTPSMISSLTGPPPYQWDTRGTPPNQRFYGSNLSGAPILSLLSGLSLPRDTGRPPNPLLDRTLGLQPSIRAVPAIRAEPEQPPWVK
jgi:hypothetical protein